MNFSELKQPFRIKGGLIDRTKPINFYFNGRKIGAFKGDSIASALLASGIHFIGRSFKYHRPRGIFSCGSEEPNALLEIGEKEWKCPNTRATTEEVSENLLAKSQNYKGSLHLDWLSINDFFSAFLSAGFYYKAFMWPKLFWEKLYEPAIRDVSGLGTLSGLDDIDTYEKGYLHCDILIIGAGPAGLLAADIASRTRARIIIADEDWLPGGRLNFEDLLINSLTGSDWASQTYKHLIDMPNVRFMKRTTVYGSFDHGIFGAIERTAEIQKDVNKNKASSVLWKIYAKQSILCTGSIERGIAFENNDRPGIMLAGSIRGYVNRFAVSPGNRIAVFTNNDSGWQTARTLIKNDINVVAIIDSRNIPAPLKIPHSEVFMGEEVIDTFGRKHLRKIKLSNGRTIKTDCLGISGGWNPAVHLTCHQRSWPVWKKSISAFVPGPNLQNGMKVTGAANGTLVLSNIFSETQTKITQIIDHLGFKLSHQILLETSKETSNLKSLWRVKQSNSKSFVDYQNDVTTSDIILAKQEGFFVPEHLKRYTTLGMATDQGKTSNVLGLAILAELNGISIEEAGTTIFRPPYTAIPIGAFAGRSRGKAFRPFRLTPSHKLASDLGATFVETGNWLRARWYSLHNDCDWQQTVNREVIQTRASVGVCDVTTLGKIEIYGKHALEFLNRIYANNFSALKIGRMKYGIMLREDGIVLDDGATARLGEEHFVMTTTTANAVYVYRHLEFCRQCLWPGYDVHLISSTDQWAQFSIAGPSSRILLQRIIDPKNDISNTAFPFMSCAEVNLCDGITGRLFRISFSGELGYELAVPTRYGNDLMRALLESGKDLEATPYGTEALGVMRIEKGHPAGNELNGQTTAFNLGLENMVKKDKRKIGTVLAQRSGLTQLDGERLMGFVPSDKSQVLRAGAHLFDKNVAVTVQNDQGWLSSATFSPSLGHHIGLGFISDGKAKIGQKVVAIDSLRKKNIQVEIVSPQFIDPKGIRLRA